MLAEISGEHNQHRVHTVETGGLSPSPHPRPQQSSFLYLVLNARVLNNHLGLTAGFPIQGLGSGIYDLDQGLAGRSTFEVSTPLPATPW